jgi:secreted Zn-dependent insulinase-like peptidase
MKQVHTNLNDEANEDWKSIKNENYKFNSKQKQIKALKDITTE